MLRLIISFVFIISLNFSNDVLHCMNSQLNNNYFNEKSSEVEIMSRILFLTQYPCMECHNEIEKKDRVLLPLKQPHHLMEFKHMDNIQNCFLCHNRFDYEHLRLINGSILSFDDSRQLCSQCHGEKKKDWENGVHGKQIGKWNGKKFRDTCVECHDPHKPAFPKMKADSPPPFPKFGIHKRGIL